MKKSGVYLIQNSSNHKKYVGSSRNVPSRKNGHFSALRIGNHPNHKLQKDFDKYGRDAFQFSILEEVQNVKDLQDREQYWLDTIQPEYNIKLTAENVSWEFNSEESRKSISESVRQRQTGRIQSQEEKDRRANSIKEFWATHPAKTIPQKMREHLSKINRGKKNPNWGKQRSDETKAKSRDSNSKIIYTFLSPDGEEVSFKSLGHAPEQVNIPYWALRQLYRGKIAEYKGWKYLYCDNRDSRYKL